MPAVFTIPPGAPFVDVLASTLLAEAGADPAALSRYTILLPTRRGARSLREAFLRQAERPLLLPRMFALGDVDIDDLDLGSEEIDPGADDIPAISDIRRQLLIARLVMGFSSGRPLVPADQAVALAGELARLLDQVETEGLSFDGLADLVPADYAEHWRKTLEFLQIVTRHWPAVLAEEGCADPAERRNRSLAGLAEAWRQVPPQTPVIAAGSTASIPATAELLAVIAGLEHGRVVLPGLDRDTSDEAWEQLEASHPQYGMARLLERLGLERSGVADWPAPGFPDRSARSRLIAAAMLPAAATDGWRRIAGLGAADLHGLRRIDCPGPQGEAGIIALLMREQLERPGETAALVTADRSLARRVATELERWHIAIDDSAGQPLGETPPGTFLRLTAAMVAEQAAPVPLLAALKHPFAAGGTEPADFRRIVRRLERLALRGPRPAAGFDGLKAAVAATRPPAGPEIADLVSWLAEAANPFVAAMKGGDLRAMVAAHVDFAEALAATPAKNGHDRLWAGAAGDEAGAFAADLAQAASGFPVVDAGTYPSLLSALMSGRVVRPAYGKHPRLFIWGPLEARLQQADLLILGGLNEGSWPAEPAADPWMGRQMRAAFGLPPPERRIGLAAHDFAQAFCARQVVLTRSERVEGTPTVPSRWLLRLDAVLRASRLSGDVVGTQEPPGLPAMLPKAQEWLSWQARLDAPAHSIAAAPPTPRPPVAARPRLLSATAIETLMRNPYAIYAKHILRLAALPPLDADPGRADYGILIHEILDVFIRSFPGDLPADATDRLLALGLGRFETILSRPGVWAFWWPRFVRVAKWFVAHEREGRVAQRTLATEITGRMTIKAPAGNFVLTAKADRIDGADGGLVIIDYKTGIVPSVSDIVLGVSPQLPLEAAIAIAGGFEGLANRVASLRYWRLSGGNPAGEDIAIENAPIGRDRTPAPDAAGLAAEALAGLRELIARFDDPMTPYHARPRAEWAQRFDDYAHLARVKEWANLGESGA